MSLSCKVEHATCNFRSGYREIYTLVPGDNVFENSHTIIVCIISKLDTIQCLWTVEYIRKPWYIHTMEHYSAEKIKELYTHEYVKPTAEWKCKTEKYTY